VNLDEARKVADAVLFEGYLLYPYRASSQKNKIRWQFGVLAPPAWTEEPSASQTEVLVEPGEHPELRIILRFLQVVPGSGDADEGVPREIELTTGLASGQTLPFEVADGVHGVVRVDTEPIDGPSELLKLRVGVENLSGWDRPEAGREEALRHSLVSAHTLLALTDATFLSLLEPPEWAGPAAGSCVNLHTYPVLVGEGRADVMLSSPIILYDHPTIAPESPGDLFDATEIDEILTLRTMTLTDEEKREARDTDERAAAIIDRADAMPAELLERLHGTLRYVRRVTGEAEPPKPWWDPGMDASVSPETDSVPIAGVSVARGSRVRLRPGSRRTDAQDMFLEGRCATVEAVLFDVDDVRHLAVTLDDDPEAADLQRWHGRFLYFSPDEVEPL